jgi:predicted nucleic acid-binding Zn ribbon protein
MERKMERLSCPSCSRYIAENAISCPKCGHVLEEGWSKKQREKSVRNFWIGFGVIALIVVLIASASCSSENTASTTINAAEYGDDWGFTVNDLQVVCKQHRYSSGIVRPHVVIRANGNEYGLNGAAMGSGLYRNARDLFLKDSQGLYTFKSQHDVLQRGLALCKK